MYATHCNENLYKNIYIYKNKNKKRKKIILYSYIYNYRPYFLEKTSRLYIYTIYFSSTAMRRLFEVQCLFEEIVCVIYIE